jgi:hypothetical protein
MINSEFRLLKERNAKCSRKNSDQNNKMLSFP